jgi:E3 ubiquitin-protein ligase RNF115/126
MLLGVLGHSGNLLSGGEDSSMDSILNYIMATDPNRYGNPPTSKKTVESLERIIINEKYIENFKANKIDQSCPVCKDDFCLKETAIHLPCKHCFHEDCIKPWLQERNTCPTCRCELPTDDPDFEARKNSA